MSKNNLLDKFLLAKPTIRMLIEWPILIGIGIAGSLFNWQRIPFSPISNIAGFTILIIGFIIHEYSHKIHKQAHSQSQEIRGLVTRDIYSKIRHPGYLGLILIYFGFAIAWGIVWLLIPVVIFTLLNILTAIREESMLTRKFGEEYKKYMKKVPWRFIPGIF